ncbi:hypothetical protein [Nocardioides sp. KR10-350]|uniref:hypothetical protein n=1 Tax=Nocardioides cheoyonin TaxID=3156615 RepID=UPI0032B50D46
MERPNTPPEQPDDEHRFTGPPAERLNPGELDFTGATPTYRALRETVEEAIEAAKRHGGEISNIGARAIARYLADYLGDQGTALHHFAVTANADFGPMSDELARVFSDRSLSVEAAEWANWLGTYIVRRAEELRGPSPANSITGQYRQETLDAIRELGPAFAAFLRLPDITEDNARDLFHESYVTSFADPSQLIADTIESLDLEQALADSDVDYFASIDPAKVLRLAREAYDVVAYQGRFYLFNK